MAERRTAGVLGTTALLAVVLLAGCTSPADEDAPPSAAPTTTAPARTTAPDEGGDDAQAEGDSEDGAAPGDAPAGEALPTAEPVPLEATADFGTGVTSALDRVEAIRAEAQGPGEVSGPALSFTVRLTNSTAADVDLGAVTVNLADEQGNPGLPMAGPPARPLSGVLAAGESVTGTYVFAVDEGSREVVSLEVSYSTQAPVVVFRGSPADV